MQISFWLPVVLILTVRAQLPRTLPLPSTPADALNLVGPLTSPPPCPHHARTNWCTLCTVRMGFWCEQLVSVVYSLGGMNYQTDSLLFQKSKDD